MENKGNISRATWRCRALALLLASTTPKLSGLAKTFGVTLALVTFEVEAERINHEGRILGPAPVVTTPILFNTPQADAVVAAMQIMPRDNPWNEDISRLPVLPNSGAMIAQVKADLSSSRQTLRPFYEMNFVLVPDNQPRVTIPFFNYPDESDLDGGTYPNGRYPIPSNMPVETWPRGTGSLTLQQWQQDVNNTGGDRHSIIVAPGVGSIWETWLTKLTSSGWEASNGAKFDLNSNALRLVVARTRREFIYPATHYASSIPASSTNYPAMGQRFRLKASFVIPSNWTIEEKAVLRALKKYGALIADNGNFFSISVCPDDRFAANAFDHLSTIDINNFEVVQTTGPTGGPRSAGAPTVDAGPDQTVDPAAGATLNGVVNAPSGNATVQWKLYSGPANVTFGSPNNASTTVSFSQTGTYTLELSADDGVHTVAYDAVVITVAPQVRLGNISTRAAVGVGQNVSIGGFIIQGDGSKQILVRALGPSLGNAGVQGVLADPVIELRDSVGNLVLANDNWKDTQQQAIQNTGLAPSDDREASILTTLVPGSYTAIVSGKNSTGGIGLVEVYEMQQAGPRLTNISTRGFVGTGSNVMIGGLILTGTEPARILFRAIGPSLAGFGIQGALADPTIDLRNAQGTPMAANNNWKDSQQATIQATGLAPSDDRESALLIDLNAGNYTAIVSGVNSTSGVALIEAYHLP